MARTQTAIELPTTIHHLDGVQEKNVDLIGKQISYGGSMHVFKCQICDTNYSKECDDDCDPKVFGYVKSSLKHAVMHCWKCLNKIESKCLGALWMNRKNTLFVTVKIPDGAIPCVDGYYTFETTKGLIKTYGSGLVGFLMNMKNRSEERIMFKNTKGELTRVSYGNYIGIPFEKNEKKDLLIVLEKEKEVKDDEYVSSSYEYEFITLMELIDSNPFLKEIFVCVKMIFHVNEFDFELKNVDTDFLDSLYEYIGRLDDLLYNKKIKQEITFLPYDLYEKITSLIGEIKIEKNVYELDEK